ncbi:hypothetical protein CRG98_046544 [Punica granatum]|uniref:Uncharacterized protein n=1 Tax=Punica granatum TaxID=22663 RepID=A0A2I0HNA9_PUNGR|nr:hypothetical protein CRG98_046544 [Punica granatum]
MDDNNNRLKNAAEEGDTEKLCAVIRNNPRILDLIDEIPFVDTPLHIAASSSDHERTESSHEKSDDSSHGRAKFSIEVAILKPSFARKLNPDGKGGRTPLHVASEIAPPQLLAELLYVCPSSIEDVTAEWQTAVHVAVEAKKSESFAVLTGWLLGVDRKNILQWKDTDGNTVLHVATLTNQIELQMAVVKGLDGSQRGCSSLVRAP